MTGLRHACTLTLTGLIGGALLVLGGFLVSLAESSNRLLALGVAVLLLVAAGAGVLTLMSHPGHGGRSNQSV